MKLPSALLKFIILQETETLKKFLMFLCFRKRESRKDISYFRKLNIQSSKIESKNTVKTFSYFRKLKFSTPSLKNSVFSGEPLRVFRHCFFSCFHVTIDITIVLGGFIVDYIYSLHHCFFRLFCFTTSFTIVFRVFSFLEISLPWLFFVRYFVFALLYAGATDLRELFSLFGVFYLTLLPGVWHKLLLSRLPWEKLFSLEGCWVIYCWFETQTRRICLFESHIVQQKVLVGRFYLCIRVLRNTM